MFELARQVNNIKHEDISSQYLGVVKTHETTCQTDWSFYFDNSLQATSTFESKRFLTFHSRSYYINRDTLFSYHKASELFLQRIMSLYVSSHYKVSIRYFWVIESYLIVLQKNVTCSKILVRVFSEMWMYLFHICANMKKICEHMQAKPPFVSLYEDSNIDKFIQVRLFHCALVRITIFNFYESEYWRMDDEKRMEGSL